MPDVRIIHLARVRFLDRDGGGTVFCRMTYDGGLFDVLAYLRPGQFPEFEGEKAWFRVRWFSKRRREFLEQIEPPPWDAPTLIATRSPIGGPPVRPSDG